MLANNGQTMGHYHLATISAEVQSIAYISYAGHVTNAFCNHDLYRVFFNVSSWLDFCFDYYRPCQNGGKDDCCTSKNCPTQPFINYANFLYDSNLLDLPCVMNKYGRITANKNTNDACIHLIGDFAKGAGDPKYRLSAQLPTNNVGSGTWYPNGTTTTDSTYGAYPSGRRHLLGKYASGGNA